jgi:hypothetical protein
MFTLWNNALRRCCWRAHRDERGTISILSVFTVLALTMLLGMVMNAGRQVDGKIRMQNAADAVSYSGAAAMARGMNTLAFTNHLLCEVFAITAWLEEARDQNAKSYVPRILNAWRDVGAVMAASNNARVRTVGQAVLQKLPLEQAVVDAFSAWAEAVSGLMLPVMTAILDQHLIPEYQRAVVDYWPDVAQATAAAVAVRHGLPQHGRGTMRGELLWPDLTPVVGGQNVLRSLPAVNPAVDTSKEREAREQRAMFARWYLEVWNRLTMRFFLSGASREYGGSARLSMFYPLWNTFTCGRLNEVLGRYHDTNLPFMIRDDLTPSLASPTDNSETAVAAANRNLELENNYVVLGVVRWNALSALMPRLFTNPVPSTPLAFAEAHYFVPQRRRSWRKVAIRDDATTASPVSTIPGFGGVPGELLDPPSQGVADPGPGDTSPGTGDATSYYWVTTEEDAAGLPNSASAYVPYFQDHNAVANRDHWTLFNQNWTARLVPAWQPGIADLPHAGGLSSQQLHTISPH